MSEDTNKPEMVPGVIGWNEIVTSDKDASIDFYSKLFGWASEEMEIPGGRTYTFFKKGDRSVAGCVVPPEDKKTPPMWLNYVNVEDIDASIAKAKGLGANMYTERVDLPMGSFAVVADPQGAAFAFWQSNEDSSSQS